MPAKPTGKVKVYRISQRQKNGDIYVLERRSIYSPEKKCNLSLGTHLIGVIRKGETEITPTRPKRPSKTKNSQDNVSKDHLAKSAEFNKNHQEKNEKCKNEVQSEDSEAQNFLVLAKRNRIGMMKIVDHIGKISGIDDAIYKSTDIGCAQKIISIARYFLCTNGQSISRIENWQYKHPLPYEFGLSENICHDLFHRIGLEESISQNFFIQRSNSIKDKKSIAYDSTTLSTYSKNIIDARYGYNTERNGLKTVKLLTLYSIDNKVPLAFYKQPGNIPDVISIKNALKQLEVIDVENVEIVTDNGYYSASNICEILLSGFNFITLIKNNLKWVRNEIDKNRDKLNSIDAICPFDTAITGTTVKVIHNFYKKEKVEGEENSKKAEVYLHIYYNERKKMDDKDQFYNELCELKKYLEEETVSIDNLEKDDLKKIVKFLDIKEDDKKVVVKYKQEECKKEFMYHGFFVLISNSEGSTFKCLEKYRKREMIESSFKYFKNNVGDKKTHVWSSDTLQGRFFVQFVALCYYEFILNKIDEIKNKLYIKEEGEDDSILKTKLKLKSWLENKSIIDILEWFDTIECVDISSPLKKKRWNTELLKTDKMLLQKLGVELEN